MTVDEETRRLIEEIPADVEHERRGDMCHTCSKATCVVIPWHGSENEPR